MNLDRFSPTRRPRDTETVDGVDAGATRVLPADSRREPADRVVVERDRAAQKAAADRDALDRDAVDRKVVDREVVDPDRAGFDRTTLDDRKTLHRDPVDQEALDRDALDQDALDQDALDQDALDQDRDALDRPEPVDEGPALDRRSVVAREREAFGGVKVGSAFFGWLTATGTAVLLTAMVSAGGTALGVLAGDRVASADLGVTWRGTRGAIAIVAILLVAYYCGGYVAGRMARFNGARQGVAVFVWAVAAAIVVAALTALAGTRWDALSTVSGLPRFSTGPTRVTADGMLVALLAVAGSLVGSVLGGLAGMRFHRRVDVAGLGR